MLNPKHILHLQQALYHILGPHDSNPNNITLSIKRGEQMLTNLRTLSSYQCLLSHYLSQVALSANNNGDRQLSTNRAKLVLLEIAKQPVSADNIWWDLLSYYYSCSENMEEYILRILRQHFNQQQQQQQQQQYCTTYRQFLTCKYWLVNDCVILSGAMKMMAVSYAVINEISAMVRDNTKLEWVQQQIEYVMEKLSQSLTILGEQYPALAQCISVYMMRLLCLGHSCSAFRQHSNHNSASQFLSKQVTNIEASINQRSQSATIKLLLSLCTNSAPNITTNQQRKCKSAFALHLPTVLPKLLRAPATKNGCWVEAMKVLNYLCTKFQTNLLLLVANSSQIIGVYEQYIDKVETRKSVHELMSNQDKQPMHGEHELEQCCSWPQLSQECRYSLLSLCLTCDSRQQLESMLKRSTLLVIKLSSFLPHPILELDHSIMDNIKAHLNSVMHHPSSSCSRDKPQLISCLRYLHRFAADNPNFDLVELCSLVLNLRTGCPDVQVHCDAILSKAVPMMITCVESSKVWDFFEVLCTNFLENYMDVTCVSYYPVLVILQSAEEHYIAHSKLNILHLLHTVLQLLVQSLRCEELSCISLTKTKKIIESHESSSATQIFYKWAEIYAKYIMALNKAQIATGAVSQHLFFNQEVNPNQLTVTVEKAMKYIFKNELYSTATAYIYVFHQTHIKNTIPHQQNNNYEILEFVKNLRTRQFWKGFDLSQIRFYGCILIGIVSGFYELLNASAEYDCFVDVLCFLMHHESIQPLQIGSLIDDFMEFSEKYDMKFPSQQFKSQLQQIGTELCQKGFSSLALQQNSSVNLLLPHLSTV